MASRVDSRRQHKRDYMRNKRKAAGENLIQGFVDNADWYLQECLGKLSKLKSFEPDYNARKEQLWTLLDILCQIKHDKCKALGTQCGHGDHCLWRNCIIIPGLQCLPPALMFAQMGYSHAAIAKVNGEAESRLHLGVDIGSEIGLYDPSKFPSTNRLTPPQTPQLQLQTPQLQLQTA